MDTFTAGQNKTHSWKADQTYEAFHPTPVNQSIPLSDERISVLLEEAVALLGELNGYSHLVPDVDYFIQMHVRNEAVKSSRIEGTKTDIDEAMLPEEEVKPDRRDDWQEVQNYIAAMNESINTLEELPISMRSIKQAHKILMSGVRGENKKPGEIRASQNWIGSTNIRTAHYVPPHPDAVPDLLTDLEKFWHNKNLQIPNLLKIAIFHYQFESIHPFLDGNGRVGRLLITLQLMECGILTRPTLYLSDYFERNKTKYYDALTFVRTRDDLDQWILFFLEGVIATAKKGKDAFENIVELRRRFEERIMGMGRKAKRGRKLLMHLFSTPIVSVNEVSELLDIAYSPANNLVKEFEEADILEETTGYSRNRLFRMTEYVNLFE